MIVKDATIQQKSMLPDEPKTCFVEIYRKSILNYLVTTLRTNFSLMRAALPERLRR